MPNLEVQREQYIKERFTDAYQVINHLGYEPITDAKQLEAICSNSIQSYDMNTEWSAPKTFGEAFQRYLGKLDNFVDNNLS